MWRRLRRRTMGPSAPLLRPELAGLVLLVVLAVAAGAWAVVQAF